MAFFSTPDASPWPAAAAPPRLVNIPNQIALENPFLFPISSVFLRLAFHKLDPHVIRALDERIFAAWAGVRAISNFDSISFQALQRRCQVVDAEADVVGHVTRGRFKVVAVLPKLRPLRLGILHGEDDEVDVI